MQFYFPNNKGIIAGTAYNDIITWLSSWKKTITVKGGKGNDSVKFKSSKYKNKLYGDAGNDTIYGGSNIDTVNGGSGNDLLYGNGGNDVIHGNSGNDKINGGAGNDKLYGDTGKDTINGNSGNDYISGAGSNDFVHGNAGNDTIYGGSGNDKLYGDADADTIYGKTGNDTIYGGSGNDKLYGDDGNDVINGDSGADYIYGGAGEDIIHGNLGNDILYGQADNDKLYGDSGNDTINGGDGNDMVYGGDGDDLIYGNSGNDTLYGDEGNDTLYAESGNNKIYGGNGDDVVYIGTDNDTVNGGKGVNFINFGTTSGNAVINYGGGTDKLYFDESSDVEFEYNNNDLIITYGDNGKIVTVKDYVNNADNINLYKGNTEIDVTYNNDPIPDDPTPDNPTPDDPTPGDPTPDDPTPDNAIRLQMGESIDLTDFTSTSEIKIVLENGFLKNQYTYDIKAVSGSRSVNIEYLNNGRLVIRGNYVNITAGEGQDDDIILIGDYNKLYTYDGDDIVRSGYVIDSGYSDGSEYKFYYLDKNGSAGNTINTGDGNDYVTLFGQSNTVNTGAGTDKVCHAGTDTKYTNLVASSECTRPQFANTVSSLNGEVEWFSQGTAGGDCRFLALLHSLTQKESLSDYITITQNDTNYDVTFLNYQRTPNNSISITTSELNSFENAYGDLDVVLADLALNKLIAANSDYGQSSVQRAYYNSFSDYMFGKSNTTYTNITGNITAFDNLWNKYSSGLINNLTLGIFSASKDPSLGIITGHAYSIKSYTDEYISLINPWDSADVLNLDIATFRNLSAAAISYGNGNTTLLSNGGVSGSYTDTEIAELLSEVSSWNENNNGINSEILNSMETENTDIISAYTSDFANNDVLML